MPSRRFARDAASGRASPDNRGRLWRTPFPPAQRVLRSRMDIERVPAESGGAFVVKGRDGSRQGELTSRLDGGRMVIDHTHVPSELRGRGAGQELVDAAVAHARHEQIRILPLCSFARGVLEGSTAYADVLSWS